MLCNINLTPVKLTCKFSLPLNWKILTPTPWCLHLKQTEVFSLCFFPVTLHCSTLLLHNDHIRRPKLKVFCSDKPALTGCLSGSLFASINFANKYSPEMGPLLQPSFSDVTPLISEAADNSAVGYHCPFKEGETMGLGGNGSRACSNDLMADNVRGKREGGCLAFIVL